MYNFPFELDDFQKEACECISNKKSVVVCAPTGAGKTVIAQHAIHCALKEGKKVFYTTPLKALSNQKFSDFSEKYGEKISFLPYGTRKKMLRYIFVYTYLCIKTIYLYCKIKPKYIVTTGTHTAGPMCYLGKLFGSKIIYIETFANRNRKTATGKLIYPIADLFIVQWEEMLELYPKAVYGGAIY